jgi:putative ABC transport system permease protein
VKGLVVLLTPLHFKWALKNLWRNPRRSIVTGLAIGSGYMGLMLFNGYFHRIERTLASTSFLTQAVGHINVYKKDGVEKAFIKPQKYSLDNNDLQNISGFLQSYKEDISLQAGVFVGVGLVGNGCRSVPFLVKGVDRKLQNWLYSNADFLAWSSYLKPVNMGKDFGLFSEQEGVITITESLAKILNKKNLYVNPQSKMKAWATTQCAELETQNKISQDTSVQLLAKTLDGGISAVEAQVGGFFNTGMIYTEDMAINAPLELVQRLYQTEKVSRWILYLKDESRVTDWKENIKILFEKKFPQYEMLFFDDNRANPFYTGVVSFLSGMGGFFTLIIGLIIALSISNSTTMNLLERSHEIGTLRSLGLTPQNLNVLLTMESIWLSFLSLILGAIMTAFVATGINNANITFEPPGASNRLQLLIHPEVRVGIYLLLFMIFLVAVVTYNLARRVTNRKVVDLLTTN